jgi:general secretion pathway protein I
MQPDRKSKQLQLQGAGCPAGTPGRPALPLARQVGFTLVEVLVALAILAIALSAAVRAASVAADSAYESKLRTLATWIAQNRISELTSQVLVSNALPGSGDSDGRSIEAGIELAWTQKISDTPNPGFRRVEVKVLRPQPPSAGINDPRQSLVVLSAFLVRPTP